MVLQRCGDCSGGFVSFVRGRMSVTRGRFLLLLPVPAGPSVGGQPDVFAPVGVGDGDRVGIADPVHLLQGLLVEDGREGGVPGLLAVALARPRPALQPARRSGRRMTGVFVVGLVDALVSVHHGDGLPHLAADFPELVRMEPAQLLLESGVIVDVDDGSDVHGGSGRKADGPSRRRRHGRHRRHRHHRRARGGGGRIHLAASYRRGGQLFLLFGVKRGVRVVVAKRGHAALRFVM
mmetsp:Transcript_12982/g.30627  ORF Transcript_12982/g.30627 Transcript_12982/m.30627 type:complete len:235 (-) Transcript_12982:194-898(-)